MLTVNLTQGMLESEIPLCQKCTNISYKEHLVFIMPENKANNPISLHMPHYMIYEYVVHIMLGVITLHALQLCRWLPLHLVHPVRSDQWVVVCISLISQDVAFRRQLQQILRLVTNIWEQEVHSGDHQNLYAHNDCSSWHCTQPVLTGSGNGG